MRALVTGASSGIGRAIARRLAADRVDLVLSGRNDAALNELASELASSVACEIVVADLNLPEAAKALWQQAAKQPIDILVNNAGVGYFREFDRIANGGICNENIVATNIASVIALSEQFLAVPSVGQRYLLNVASTVGFGPVPNMAVYAASKAFVRSFSDSLWFEQRKKGVSITCVCPGGTRTNFHATAGAGNYGWLANRSMLSAETVADRAVRAMWNKKRHYVPGFSNKVATTVTTLLPQRAAMRLAAWVLGKPR